MEFTSSHPIEITRFQWPVRILWFTQRVRGKTKECSNTPSHTLSLSLSQLLVLVVVNTCAVCQLSVSRLTRSGFSQLVAA